MPAKVDIRVHPPTAGVGVLCIDGGGVRGIVPLGIMKRIKDRIGLPLPFQRFFRVAFGISSGGLIVSDVFINGCSVEKSTERFERFARTVFQRHELLNIPFLPRYIKLCISYLTDNLQLLSFILRVSELLISYFADGLYSSKDIKAVLK
ncbi:putative patatin-like phospholipase [Ilyonectria robusta]